MFWARERERKDKIEWMAANIYLSAISAEYKNGVLGDKTDEELARKAFVIAEGFVDEAERRAK